MKQKLLVFLLCILSNQAQSISLKELSKEHIEMGANIASRVISRALPSIIKPNYLDKKSLVRYAVASTVCSCLFELAVTYILEAQRGIPIEDYKDIYKEKQLENLKKIIKKLENATGIKAKFYIVEDWSLNAEAMTGFKGAHISINSGWLSTNKEVEKHLYPILCHEAGHIMKNHSAKSFIANSLMTMLINLIEYRRNLHIHKKWYSGKIRNFTHEKILSTVLFHTIFLLALPFPFFVSRMFEFEADTYATNFVSPEKLADALTAIACEEEKDWRCLREMFSTHPFKQKRINRLRNFKTINQNIWTNPECYKCG